MYVAYEIQCARTHMIVDASIRRIYYLWLSMRWHLYVLQVHIWTGEVDYIFLLECCLYISSSNHLRLPLFDMNWWSLLMYTPLELQRTAASTQGLHGVRVVMHSISCNFKCILLWMPVRDDPMWGCEYCSSNCYIIVWLQTISRALRWQYEGRLWIYI